MAAVWPLDLPDSEKLVALALADWSNDEGECWPSVPQIAKKCSKSERTVQTVTARLEEKGLLTRIVINGRGCRYRLHPRNGCTTTPAEIAPPQPLRGEAAAPTPATAAPNTLLNHQSSEADASSVAALADAARPQRRKKVDRKNGKERKRTVGSRLTDGWQPPAIAELPLEIQAIVTKWPDGAYPLTALQFRNHWLAEGRAIGAKRDWMRTWCNWLYRENAQILLLVKRGFDFSAGRAAEAPAAVRAERDTEAGRRLAAMREAEGDAARAIRKRIRDDAGERTYAGWIAPAAIAVDGGEVTVTSASDFMGSWLEQHFAAAFQAVAGTVLGRPARVFFRVLKLDSG